MEQADDGQRAHLTELLAQARVLVVDDEPGMRNFLVKTLSPHCRAVAEAANTDEATECLEGQHFDIMLLDNMMPGRKGLDWLVDQNMIGGVTDVIMVTAYADLETAIEAMRAGASDFILKPFRTNQLLNAVRRCLQTAMLRRENRLLRRELEQADVWRRQRNRLLGSSPEITAIRDTLDRIKEVDTPLLITGASGTGKEVAARHLHAASSRASRPFVPVNCATIPRDMIEVDLFGHAAGAFPGAGTAREGLLASAQGGTVFLDEVAELAPHAQTALLRVLEDGLIRPVGTERSLQLDARFVFATSKSLAQEVEDGRFRADLYFRIDVLNIQMPPLAQRGSDVLELADMFIDDLSQRLGLPRLEIGASARAALLRHHWPGNIRELRNFVERSLIFGGFPLDTLAAGPADTTSIEPLEHVERREILRALDAVGGNRSEAARRLGVSRKTIDRKCAAWGL